MAVVVLLQWLAKNREKKKKGEMEMKVERKREKGGIKRVSWRLKIAAS